MQMSHTFVTIGSVKGISTSKLTIPDNSMASYFWLILGIYFEYSMHILYPVFLKFWIRGLRRSEHAWVTLDSNVPSVRNARGTPPSANNVNSRGPSWPTSEHFWYPIANQVMSRHVCFWLWPYKRTRSAPNMLSVMPTLTLLTKANVTNMCDNWIGKGDSSINAKYLPNLWP